MLPHTFQRSFRREPLAGIPATAKRASIFHNISRNRDSIDIGRVRLTRDPRHSLPVGKRSLSPNGLSSTLRLARDYEKRIDVVHAMILVQ